MGTTSLEDVMRILHVLATGTRRGAEVFASDLVGALPLPGVDHHVAVLRGSSVDVPFQAPTSLLAIGSPNVHMLRIDVAAARRIRRLASAWRPDVVQVHGGEALKHTVAALLGTTVPVVYRRVGLAPAWLTRGVRREAYAWLMRCATRVVAVAEVVGREAVETFHLPASKVLAIPNAVDSQRMVPARGRDETRRSLGLRSGVPVVISIGTLSWEKDPLAHVQISSRILREREVVHVWIGDGPMRRAALAAAERAGLGGRLLLLGSRADVADVLSAADVLLLASRVDGMEGMPAVVIEAGMAGLPVAAFAVAGVPEVVVDGETGILAQPGDTDALALRVVELLDDRERRVAMGRAARERCLARFEIRSIAKRFLSLYEEVAA